MSKRQTNSESVRANDPWSDTGTARLTDEGDSLLFAAISRYFKALGDIEQIRNDPGFEEAKKNAGEMVSGYHGTETGSEENKDFIRESLAGRTGEESLNEEINVIKHEISQSNINEISSQWVREWNEKKEWNSREDEKTEEIREFISDSLRRKTHRSFLRADTAGKTVSGRFLNYRFISLAAAGITGLIFLIRAFLPSYDSDKFFGKYYEPLPVVSSVTRGPGTGENEIFSSAVGSYKKGDYKSAADSFAKVMSSETESVAPRFFLGITQMARGRYGQAIALLSDVADRKGEYTKEAEWYLGLAYIKTGNKIKAVECFKLLAGSPGFYRERSEKILRRLR